MDYEKYIKENSSKIAVVLNFLEYFFYILFIGLVCIYIGLNLFDCYVFFNFN